MSDLDGPEITLEIEPTTSFFKLVLQFEKHNSSEWTGTQTEEELATYEKLVETEVNLMRQTFTKGQKNILVMEAAHENTEFRQLFAQRYATSNSAREAYSYGSLVVNYNREPKDREELEAVANYLFDHLKGEDLYGWAVFDAVDQLNQEDFAIDLVKEKFTATPDVDPKKPDKILDVLATKATERNKTIKSQIEEISDRAQTDHLHTNMLVILGLLHNELIEILPEAIRQNAYAVTEFDPNRPHPELISLVDQAIRQKRQNS